jgi:hypothetical protein
MSESEIEAEHSKSDESKLEDYEGYKEYKKKINPEKLFKIEYNFDPVKLAIDTLFQKCYENEQSSKDIRVANDRFQQQLNKFKDKIFDYDLKFVIVESKIGSIDPNHYQFSAIYKDIYFFCQKLDDFEKQIAEVHSTQEGETLEYVKNELRNKMPKLQEKVKQIAQNIETFIALHDFKSKLEYLSDSHKASESNSKKNTADLASFDPLIGKIPQGFEEEKACLILKLKN